VEDGDEHTLFIEYADRKFVTEMAPWTASDVRQTYGENGTIYQGGEGAQLACPDVFIDDDDDYIYYIEQWPNERFYYCADCAPLDAKRFAPDLYVQENGALPTILCETCGNELTASEVAG
jgi:hypothetical protein